MNIIAYDSFNMQFIKLKIILYIFIIIYKISLSTKFKNNKMEIQILHEHFPMDIVNIIYDMKIRSEHYNKLSQSFKDICIQSTIMHYSYLYDLQFEHPLQLENSEIERRKHYSKDMIDVAVSNLHQCRCCDKHQVNKPKSTHTDVHMYRMYFDGNIPPKRNNECKCCCRSLSRRILRHFIMSEEQHDDLFRHILYYKLRKVKTEIECILNDIFKHRKDTTFSTEMVLYNTLYSCRDEEVYLLEQVNEHILIFPQVVHVLDAIFLIDILEHNPNNTPNETDEEF